MKWIKDSIALIAFLYVVVSTSIAPPEPLPDRIRVNQYVTWNVKKRTISLDEEWRTLTRHQADSVCNDAAARIDKIVKTYKY